MRINEFFALLVQTCGKGDSFLSYTLASYIMAEVCCENEK